MWERILIVDILNGATNIIRLDEREWSLGWFPVTTSYKRFLYAMNFLKTSFSSVLCLLKFSLFPGIYWTRCLMNVVKTSFVGKNIFQVTYLSSLIILFETTKTKTVKMIVSPSKLLRFPIYFFAVSFMMICFKPSAPLLKFRKKKLSDKT